MSTTVRDTYGFSVDSSSDCLTSSERTAASAARPEVGPSTNEAKWSDLLSRLTALPPSSLAPVTSRWSNAHTPKRSLAYRVLRSKVGLDKDQTGVKFTKRVREGVPAEMR